MPSELDGTLQVTRGELTSPELPITMNGALLDFQSVTLPVRSGPRKDGIVLGHVLSPAGKPVSGARVEIPMSAVSATTRDDGSFRLVGVQSGTQMLVARSLSFGTAAEPINVTAREPVDVSITLFDKVNVLDPVLVTARRDLALEKSGFSARKRAGAGYFFTREDIDKRQPNNITDMLKNLPIVNVSSRRGGTVITRRGGITSMYSAVPSCTNVFIDDFQWQNMGPGDLDMFVNPDDVIGIEVYRGEDVPARFRRFGQGCVALVLWTQFRGKAAK